MAKADGVSPELEELEWWKKSTSSNYLTGQGPARMLSIFSSSNRTCILSAEQQYF